MTGPPSVPLVPPIAEIARRGAANRPDDIAIVAPELDARWTYGALDDRVGRAQALLRQYGLQVGDRIAYLGRNSDNLFVLLLAAARGGHILAPLNWRSAPAEIAYLLEDATPRLLLCDPEFLPAVDASGATTPVLPTEAAEGRVGLRTMLDETAPTDLPAVHHEDLPCLLLYTSGTTGRPKGALIDQRALLMARHIELGDPQFPVGDDERILVSVPAFHLGGITMMLIGLIRGATCILTQDASAANMLALSRRHAVTLTWLVPTMIHELVEVAEAEHVRLPHLRTIMYGAAPISPDLLMRARDILGCGLSNAYGATEIGTCTLLPPADHDPARPDLLRSVGRALAGTRIEVRAADGQPLPAGTAGEVWVETPARMTRYWNRPEETAAVLVDGWYRTGDGGYLDEAGYLYLTDRIKDMILSGGENIYPVEVENALRAHPAVQDVAVVGMPDERWGETVAAVIELRPGSSLAPDDAIRHVRERLAHYKAPRLVRFVERLPRTASGKVSRHLVRKSLADG